MGEIDRKPTLVTVILCVNQGATAPAVIIFVNIKVIRCLKVSKIPGRKKATFLRALTNYCGTQKLKK
jgi:hypothetical protein